MNHRKKVMYLLSGALGMSVLILDGQTALSGAAEGVELCLRTVIPSLFPFFILSTLMTGSLSGMKLPFFAPLGRLCRMPKGSEGLLLMGFLGGYPAGAQSVTQAYRAGALDSRNARRLLGFCSNAGPAFLFGMLSGMFTHTTAPWVLWIIHMASALLVGILLPCEGSAGAALSSGVPVSPAKALEQSVKVMGTVCGWVVAFRVVIAFFRRWLLWLLPIPVQVVLTGLAELSNGCCALSEVADEGLRFMICSVLLGFGGLCVFLQTVSVTGELGTGMYFPGKVLQAWFSFVLSWSVKGILYPAARDLFGIPLLAVTGFAYLCLILKNRKNYSSNFRLQGV